MSPGTTGVNIGERRMGGASGDRAHWGDVHRSFRAAPAPVSAILSSLLAPLGITWAFFHYAGKLLAFHEGLRLRLLMLGGIPVEGASNTVVFHGVPVSSAVTSMASYAGRAWLPWVCCGAIALGLGIVFARVRLSRGIAGCAFALLAASAISGLVYPKVAADSSFFVSFWLRCEFVVWLFVPWVVAMLTAFIVPSFWLRLGCSVIGPVYGVIWSAARLALCVGVLYVSGPVLDVFLWFSLGLLSDVLYLCTLYSFAVYYSAARGTAER